MHKRSSDGVKKGKTNTNVTIIKFKSPETSKGKQVLSKSVIEQDPLAITDYDLKAAGPSSSNLKVKPATFTSIGARKELPAIKKNTSALTLLTPTGVKKIQAIPIELDNREQHTKSSKKTKTSSTKKVKSPKANKSKYTAPSKRPSRSKDSSLYIDSSDDSDEPLRKILKKSPQSLNKKRSAVNTSSITKKVKASSSHKNVKKVVNKNKTRSNKAKKSSKYTNKAKQKEKGNNTKKKMIQKRNQRCLDYRYISPKAVKNGKAKGKKTYLSVYKKQKKTIDDYLPLIREYRYLIPEDSYVKVERLKFSASHFTKERIRLTSDIDLFRDGATFYGLLGKIFNHLDLIGKLKVTEVCRLWNRATNEDAAWQCIKLENVTIFDLRQLERLILKRETRIISLNNVDVIDKAIDYELCRLSSVKQLVIQESSSPLLLNKFLVACNELENIVVPDTSLNYLGNLNVYIKSVNAENLIVSESENRLIKTWSDLEKLVIHSFDAKFYFNMGLLLSLKYLKMKHLCITTNIAQFIENIPNIEYIEFTPHYFNISHADGNKAVVDSLKHCPSLKKLVWNTVKEIEIIRKKIEIKPKCLKDIFKEVDSTIITKKESTLPNDEVTHTAETEINVYDAPNQMEIDIAPLTENLQHAEVSGVESKMETNEIPQITTHASELEKGLETPIEENIPQQGNIDMFDCVNSTQNKSSMLTDIESESKHDDEKDEKEKIKEESEEEKIKEEFEEEETKVKDESDEDNKHTKDDDSSEVNALSNKYHAESLELLALKTYLKSSLPECEVIFRVILKYKYIDE